MMFHFFNPPRCVELFLGPPVLFENSVPTFSAPSRRPRRPWAPWNRPEPNDCWNIWELPRPSRWSFSEDLSEQNDLKIVFPYVSQILLSVSIDVSMFSCFFGGSEETLKTWMRKHGGDSTTKRLMIWFEPHDLMTIIFWGGWAWWTWWWNMVEAQVHLVRLQTLYRGKDVLAPCLCIEQPRFWMILDQVILVSSMLWLAWRSKSRQRTSFMCGKGSIPPSTGSVSTFRWPISTAW